MTKRQRKNISSNGRREDKNIHTASVADATKDVPCPQSITPPLVHNGSNDLDVTESTTTGRKEEILEDGERFVYGCDMGSPLSMPVSNYSAPLVFDEEQLVPWLDSFVFV